MPNGSSDHDSKETALSVEASILRSGYNIGLFDKHDIERWADEQITASDQPSDALLDLSMIRSTHPIDVMNLLSSLAGSIPAEVSIAVQIGIIGMCYCVHRISLQSAVQGLYALNREHGITDEQSSTIYWLDDGYDLAVTGCHGTLEEVETEFQEFVEPYIQHLRDRHNRLFRK